MRFRRARVFAIHSTPHVHRLFTLLRSLDRVEVPRRRRLQIRASEPAHASGRGTVMSDIEAKNLIAALDEASLGRFHFRAVLVSGMGFFTDAYDLFIIGIASALITQDWHLSSGMLALLNSTM